MTRDEVQAKQSAGSGTPKQRIIQWAKLRSAAYETWGRARVPANLRVLLETAVEAVLEHSAQTTARRTGCVLR